MQEKYFQNILPLTFPPSRREYKIRSSVISDSSNSIKPEDRAFHSWYRFVLSYPPHLVRDYIKNFSLGDNAVILDPFCGTGTTIVEAKINHIRAIGLEANPFPHFAASVKVQWNVDVNQLEAIAKEISENTYASLDDGGINNRLLISDPTAILRTLDEKAMRALIKNSISPLPLHKALILFEKINHYKDTPFHKYYVLALGNALVSMIGNLRFGPEVGVGKIKKDVHVVSAWMQEVTKMVEDLRTVDGKNFPKADVFLADARELPNSVQENSIDAIITSPPYPNEKDYTRTTRLESVVLGFFEDMLHIRGFKKTLLRSNTRGVYKTDSDDEWINDIEEVQRLANAIEARRIELGKTSGFEKQYGRVTKLYFGGMARHFSDLTRVLKPGANLAYVVGDQASYLRVMIRTGKILAEIAERLGYQVERIDLFRTRFSTATQEELREEVLVLKWLGNK